MPISAFETLKLLFFSRPSNIAEPRSCLPPLGLLGPGVASGDLRGETYGLAKRPDLISRYQDLQAR